MGRPAIIEAAITPLRWGAPAQSVETMVSEASACIGAGAGIVVAPNMVRPLARLGLLVVPKFAGKVVRLLP